MPDVLPGHAHLHGPGALTLDERHAHEAEVYDALAESILATATDDELRVDPGVLPVHNREHLDYLSHAVEVLRPLEGARILEVGAGSGALAVWLAQQGAHVTGIDVSGGILEVARRRAEVSEVADRCGFEHVAVEHLRTDVPFDAIIGNNVVHHFELDRAAANLASLLAPRGTAAFCEPVLFAPGAGTLRRLRYHDVVARRFPPHTHTPDERSLELDDLDVLRAWFAEVGWRPFQLTCRLQNFVELSDPTWQRLERTDRWLLGRASVTHRLCRMAVLTLRRPRPAAPEPTAGAPAPIPPTPNRRDPS